MLRRLLPDSLFGRVILMIALLLIFGQFAVNLLFEEFAAEPRTLHATRLVVGYINTVTAALETMPDDSEADFLDGLATNDGVRVVPANNPLPELYAPSSPLVRSVADALAKRIGPEVIVRIDRKPQPDIWVRFNANEQTYWLIVPRQRLESSQSTLHWSGRIAGIGLLSLLGALFIIWHINRPLKELAEDAEKIGSEEHLGLLRESGPSEIRSLARTINGMLQNLTRLNAERTLLLAGVSHDLRTPLARMRLMVEMVDDDKDPTLKPAIIQDIEEMDGIIGQFLAYARGETPEDPVQGSVNELVSEVVASFSRAGKRVYAALDQDPSFAFRPLAMRRLINNLVDNALKHGSDEVEIRTVVADRTLALRVLDRGRGIDAGSSEWLLQPFTRQESEGVAGAGLGLAICNRIVKMHGGRLTLNNRDGGGLEVRAEFPLG